MSPAVALIALLIPSSADFPTFKGQEIDPHAGEIVYAVTTADVNGDKKPDVVALTEDAVIWYENPSWTKHVIIQGKTTRDNVCIQPHDIDGDGKIDFAVGAGWRPPDTTNASTLQWIGRDDKGEWQVHPIQFDEPSMHRIRFGEVLGNGKTQLVVAPLQGKGTKGPNWGEGAGARMLVYSIPDDPTTLDWPFEVASDKYHTIHNLQIVDETLFGGKDFGVGHSILLATREGVVKLVKRPDGTWLPIQVASEADAAKSPGAGEVKRGLVPGNFYVAAIEPFHGSSVVAYVSNGNGKPSLRSVLNDKLAWGHGLWCADLDGDGAEELVVGQRDPNKANAGTDNPVGPGIFVYDPDPSKTPMTFTRHIIDDGSVAVEDLVAEDLDGDGKPEIIAGGRASHNVKIFWNRGK